MNGLVAELYANPALEGTPAVTRLDPQVAFNWLLSDADPAVGSAEASALRMRGS